jgi:hypothetical protein
MKLDSRQIATILHALRVQQLGCSPNECEHFDEVTTQLDSDEMDELCEQLNTTGTRSPTMNVPQTNAPPEFTFEGITVTLVAPDAQAAYAFLCAALGTLPDAEFTTDTFSGPGFEDDTDTSELWNTID